VKGKKIKLKEQILELCEDTPAVSKYSIKAGVEMGRTALRAPISIVEAEPTMISTV
jgi:hypothetical protein